MQASDQKRCISGSLYLPAHGELHAHPNYIPLVQHFKSYHGKSDTVGSSFPRTGRPGSPQWMKAPLTAIRAHDHGHEAAVVGHVVAEYCGLVTLAIPYSPVAGPLGFKALPPLYLLAVVVVVAYFASAELTKRWFYRERGASAKQL